MGWALLGLADTIPLLPEAQRLQLEPLTLDLAQRVAGLQDVTGFWHTVIDDREAYLETSTAAFFGAAFLRLARSGRADWVAPGKKALNALLGRIDDNGAVWGVSAVTWAATSPEQNASRYKVVPTEFNLWGQGSGMRALSEAIRLAQSPGT
jgi:unsaturated rhamnogalacturonyl hydrolase